MNKKTFFILLSISIISLFINLYKKDVSPSCFNTDEAAVGYNAYSLLKTGRDEYGTFLPLRLKSFGDYKMPLYSYLSVPFIALGGLNEFSTRAANTAIAVLFPFVIFALTKQLFGKKEIGYLAAFLFSISPAIQTVGRQAHEAYLTTFFILLSLWLLFQAIDKSYWLFKFLFLLSLVPLSFGYQFSRLWLGLIFIIVIYFIIKKKLSGIFLLLFFLTFFSLIIPDIIIKPARLGNLLFFNNIGLGLQTAELRSEGGTRLFYNKATVGFKNFLFSHLTYYSPQFLVTQGDDNRRFASPGISPITLIEYLLLFIGLYYLFKDKQKWRFLLVFCLLISPLAGSLSWAGNSITRSLPVIIFINIICAYGFIRLINNSSKKIVSRLALGLVVLTYFIFCFYSWDFYFNHYPKRAQTIRAWQCGNREMATYVKENYQKTDKFYITKKNGQPYIFLLFYLQYPPRKYQEQAQLSSPDEFGFGQVEKFDKFIFHFQMPAKQEKAISIGYPDDFNNLSPNQIERIKVINEEIFWMYQKD